MTSATGVHESVKEGHELQVEVQTMYDKIRELQRRKAEIDDLFSRKSELMATKEEEYSKRVKEANALGVTLNLNAARGKLIAKYRELEKSLEQWESGNKTLAKMHKTKESIFMREMEEVSRDADQKDREIDQIDQEITTVKGVLAETLER